MTLPTRPLGRAGMDIATVVDALRDAVEATGAGAGPAGPRHRREHVETDLDPA